MSDPLKRTRKVTEHADFSYCTHEEEVFGIEINDIYIFHSMEKLQKTIQILFYPYSAQIPFALKCGIASNGTKVASSPLVSTSNGWMYYPKITIVYTKTDIEALEGISSL